MRPIFLVTSMPALSAAFVISFHRSVDDTKYDELSALESKIRIFNVSSVVSCRSLAAQYVRSSKLWTVLLLIAGKVILDSHSRPLDHGHVFRYSGTSQSKHTDPINLAAPTRVSRRSRRPTRGCPTRSIYSVPSRRPNSQQGTTGRCARATSARKGQKATGRGGVAGAPVNEGSLSAAARGATCAWTGLVGR